MAHHHRILSEALNHDVKWGLLARNVCQAVDPPRGEKRDVTTLAAEEVPALLEAARELEHSTGQPYYMLFLAALHTGARRGELLGLRWKDVVFDGVEGREYVCVAASSKRFHPDPGA